MSLRLRPEQILLPSGLHSGMELRVEGERILSIEPTAESPNLPRRLLMPGFVNAHSHAFQRGIRGWVQWPHAGGDFWSWRESMYALAAGLDPEGVELLSRVVYGEMLEAGYTSVGEFHYLHHQPDGRPYEDREELAWRVHAAADQVGIRLCMLRVAYARAGFERELHPVQRRFIDADPEETLRSLERLQARGPAGLAPHSVRAVPASWLRCFAAADPAVLHMHVDEQQREVEECLGETGLRPVAWLESLGLLSPSFVAVHLTCPSDEEIQLMRDAGARICVCPSTELDLGDGVFPAHRARGLSLSVGSDSHALVDPFFELRALEWGARGELKRRNVLAEEAERDALARSLLRHGSAGGAEALGLDCGVLSPGRLADMITIDLEDHRLLGGPLLPSLVFSGGRGLVREVWVGGTQRVAEGRLIQGPPDPQALQKVLSALEH